MRVLVVLILFSSLSARAELFICNGEGRFASVKRIEVEVGPQKQEVEIFRSGNEVVRLSVDDANSDGSHYLKIMVQGSDGHIRTSKASHRGMVMWIDQYGVSVDIIACLPVPGT